MKTKDIKISDLNRRLQLYKDNKKIKEIWGKIQYTQKISLESQHYRESKKSCIIVMKFDDAISTEYSIKYRNEEYKVTTIQYPDNADDYLIIYASAMGKLEKSIDRNS